MNHYKKRMFELRAAYIAKHLATDAVGSVKEYQAFQGAVAAWRADGHVRKFYKANPLDDGETAATIIARGPFGIQYKHCETPELDKL